MNRADVARRLFQQVLAACYGAGPGALPPVPDRLAPQYRSRSLAPRKGVPDLPSQLEELLSEVWRQERFEHLHPFTCAVIRQSANLKSPAGQAVELTHS
jgi:hypothetical protein